MNSSNASSLIEHKQDNTFSEIFWRKIREELRMEILIEKKPKKPLKLYEINEEDLNIDLPKVTQWSEDNAKLYFLLRENGFADFICNKESLISTYTQLIFDNLKITQMDPLLTKFENLNLLRLNKNRIKFVENIPPNLKELHLYGNPIYMISNKIRQEQLLYLGLGYCQLNDQAIELLAKRFPNLVCLDLTHNNLCDMEAIMENVRMFSSLKVLNLYGNPIALLTYYVSSIVNQYIQIKYFDEQSAAEIRNRMVQAEQARQAAIQAEIKRQQDEAAAKEAELLKDKNKKGAKAPPPQQQQPKKEEIQAPVRLNTQPSKTLDKEDDIRISIRDNNTVKITINVRTLENLDGILLDRWTYPEMEQKPELYQSKYWIKYTFMDKEVEDRRINYEEGDPEKGRIDFENTFEYISKPTVELRDFIERGLLISVHCEQPVMIMSEDGDKRPDLDSDGTPRQEQKVLGICKVEMDWLRSINRDVSKKYNLFAPKVQHQSELWYPLENERDLIESRMQFITEQIKTEEDQLKAQLASIEAKKNEALKGGKGKEVKKKDDKKQAKKGKDAEPEKKVIQQLDWQVHDRTFIYVNETKILRALPYLLGVNVQIGD